MSEWQVDPSIYAEGTAIDLKSQSIPIQYKPTALCLDIEYQQPFPL